MSDPQQLRDTQRRVGQTEVGEKALTLLPLNPHDGVISPFAANANPFLAPIWRDCTPARLAMSLYCSVNDGANYWTIGLTIAGPSGFAFPQGSVNTSALAAGQWLPLALTTFSVPRWTAANFTIAYVQVSKTGAPGNLYLSPALYVL